MINGVPRRVFAFLHMMWGGVKNKYMTFLTPKIVKEAKKDLVDLKSDCEAIVWILENKDADYSGVVANAYSNQDVRFFAGSKAIIYLHENLFELCGVKFEKSLIPDELSKEEALRFYKDYPSEVSIIRRIYRDFVRNGNGEAAYIDLLNKMKTKYQADIENFSNAIKSLSDFDAVDYAIAMQDYNYPERAEAFFRTLEKALNETITKH